MAQNQEELLSIRKEQQAYQSQIRKTYQNYPHLFVTHSSDLLHLDIIDKHSDSTPYKALVTKSKYNKYDIITEIRGSIIGYSKLKSLIQGKVVDIFKLPKLLYLNYETQYLLSPKNIGKYLFTNPIYERVNEKLGKGEKVDEEDSGRRNCYVESHFGSKLLAIASRDIAQGEQLILQQKYYNKMLYKYNDKQF